MYKYIITFKDVPGDEISISYNSDKRLLKIDASAASKLSAKQVGYIKNITPEELTNPFEQFSEMIKLCKGKIDIVESEFDVDFLVFWEAYNYKRHKKPAESLYSKLSYADKYKCIASIKGYNSYRSRKGEWLEQMLPDTYIRQREFETEWNNVR